MVYGPYISLPAGSYRAEFTVFLDDVPDLGTEIGHVDVVSIGTRVRATDKATPFKLRAEYGSIEIKNLRVKE